LQLAASVGTTFQLIVGLGNPGREYAQTRHNVGFMILDRLAEKAGGEWRAERQWKAEVTRVDGVHLCKPQTYMNLSGRAVNALVGFYKIPASAILVVLDDMALPLGKLRLRPSGSAGGHNGLQSVIEHLGTPEVARLRAGIGAAQPGEAVGHVLGSFTEEERPLLAETIDRSVAAIECAQANGLPAAMNAFN
jgi:PTH1 family peptidyl-tRNA hydrolase